MTAKNTIEALYSAARTAESYDVLESILDQREYFRLANVIGAAAGLTVTVATIQESLWAVFTRFKPDPMLLVAFFIVEAISLLAYIFSASLYGHWIKRGLDFSIHGFFWGLMLAIGSVIQSILSIQSDALALGWGVWMMVTFCFLELVMYVLPTAFGGEPRFYKWLRRANTFVHGGVGLATKITQIQSEARKSVGRFSGGYGEEKKEEPPP